MSTITEPVTDPAKDKARWIALIVVCLAQFMNVVDSSVVNVALPALQQDLGLSQADLTWVVDAYLIAFGSFLLPAGRLGDLLGRRRVFLIGVAIFTAASVACGLAQDGTVLIAARFIQGIGGAVSSSAILAIIVTEFPRPDERAKAMSAYTFVVVGGGSIGLLAGGLLTQSLDWHWIFFVNVPFGVAAFLLGAALIERTPGLGASGGIDVLGSILVTVATMLGIYAIVKAPEYGWTSGHTLGFGAAALALLAAFLVLEARLANPIMPLRILRVRSLVVSSAVRALLVTGMFSTFFLGALYLQRVLGFDPLQTGLAFLPVTLGVAVLSLGITARLVARFGPLRVLTFGLAIAAGGLLLLTGAGADGAYFPTIAIGFAAIGIGAGTSFVPLLTLALGDVPKEDAGLASGIVNVSLQIGGALGLAVLGALATHRTNTLLDAGESRAQALTAGYHLAFVVGAGSVLAGLLVSRLLARSPAAT